MRTVVFLDLDDTLFQTFPKSPPGEGLSTAAVRQDGSPISYMTPRQQALLRLLENGEVIPVTARSLDAFRRVRLSFSSLAVLDFGGVVLLPDRSLDPVWDRHVRPCLAEAEPHLRRLLDDALGVVSREGLGVRPRLIRDFGMTLYLVIKHPGHDLAQLDRCRRALLPYVDPGRFYLAANDNNLSLVPRCLGKEKAVRHILEHRLGAGPFLTLGAGDSFSDAPFLDLCDFCLVPRRSQLWLAADKMAHAFLRIEQDERHGSPALAAAREPSQEPNHAMQKAPLPTFSGSFDPEDVAFLLRPVQMDPTPVAVKERLIQTGQKHYSEMISTESPPSPLYLRIFHEGLERQKERLARHLLLLARLIVQDHPDRPELVLASLARAGTPIGVLLTRILRRLLGRTVHHYSLSIIRDRGIDENALRHVLACHPAAPVAFVDGWTGKGVIADELERSVDRFNARHGQRLDPGLYVVADLCGRARASATAEDYLIPPAILGGVVGGLVSRSILNDSVVGPGDFHACVVQEHLREHDLSRWLADTLFAEVERQALLPEAEARAAPTEEDRRRLRRRSEALLADLQARHGVRSRGHVKPGVGEATRVLLRRVPDRLLLRDPDHPDVAHLRWLADRQQVPVLVEPALPCLAVALIKEVEA